MNGSFPGSPSFEKDGKRLWQRRRSGNLIMGKEVRRATFDQQVGYIPLKALDFKYAFLLQCRWERDGILKDSIETDPFFLKKKNPSFSFPLWFLRPSGLGSSTSVHLKRTFCSLNNRQSCCKTRSTTSASAPWQQPQQFHNRETLNLVESKGCSIDIRGKGREKKKKENTHMGVHRSRAVNERTFCPENSFVILHLKGFPLQLSLI